MSGSGPPLVVNRCLDEDCSIPVTVRWLCNWPHSRVQNIEIRQPRLTAYFFSGEFNVRYFFTRAAVLPSTWPTMSSITHRARSSSVPQRARRTRQCPSCIAFPRDKPPRFVSGSGPQPPFVRSSVADSAVLRSFARQAASNRCKKVRSGAVPVRTTNCARSPST